LVWFVGYFYPRHLVCVCWHPEDFEESSVKSAAQLTGMQYKETQTG
jgi:hypothetical protein